MKKCWGRASPPSSCTTAKLAPLNSQASTGDVVAPVHHLQAPENEGTVPSNVSALPVSPADFSVTAQLTLL